MGLSFSELVGFQRPARYIDGEINARRKEWDRASVRVLLAYPDLYDIGMSSYGYQLLYSSINREEGVLCDRAFLPWKDLLEHIDAKGVQLWGLETKRAVREFDVVAFSVHYELCYTNILWFLKLSGVSLFRDERGEGDPIVVAGGPCVLNPTPLAPFIDAFFLGEWDLGVAKVFKSLGGIKGRRERLFSLSEHPSIYVPGFNGGGKRRIEPLSIFPDPPLVPLIEVPHNRITVEIARGCPNGCRFCHAGYIYRPLREREPREVIEIIEKGAKSTGFEEVSLLALSATDYSRIEELILFLSRISEESLLSISLPSFRAGTLTPKMIEAIKKVRKTGFTIAPEAGSQRLRDVINKGITEEEVLDTVEKAVYAGWQTIKLYFMIGLPTETQEDIEAIGDLISKVLRISGRLPRKPKINVTVSPFVPKPHTPFQWEAQEPLGSLKEKIGYLKRRFRRSRVKIKEHDPHQSLVEALLSRGDERTSQILYEAFLSGAVFDQWGELFDFSIWKDVMEKFGIDPDSPSPALPVDAPLAWDNVDVGVKRQFLLEEKERAYKRASLSACRIGCRMCGVCGEDVRVKLANEGFDANPELPVFKREKSARYLCYLQKLSPSHLVGQNDTEALLHRAFRRAGLPLAYSQGFSPHPAISFADATSLGVEVVMQPFELGLWKQVSLQEILSVNRYLPSGMRVVSVQKLHEGAPSIGKLKREDMYVAFVPLSLKDRIEERREQIVVLDRTPDKLVIITNRNPVKLLGCTVFCFKKSRIVLEANNGA